MSKLSFTTFLLLEARIAVPETALEHTMHVVCSAYFSYIAYLAKQSNKKLGQGFLKKIREARSKYGNFQIHNMDSGEQYVHYEIQYPTAELPEHYTRKLQLKEFYPVTIVAGDLRSNTQNAAEFFEGSDDAPPMLRVNIGSINGLEDRLGHPEAVDEDLHELESNVKHELQHVTQDIVLGKLHPKQKVTPEQEPNEDLDAYYASDIEFQPQITTAVGDFKQKIGVVRSKQQLDSDTITALMRAYVNPNGQMPQGLLKYKPYFQSAFFNALFKKDKAKWKKAVKDFHGLFRS